MKNLNNKLILRVSESLVEDVGKGIARLDKNNLMEINALPGDCLEIKGKKTTVAKAAALFPEYSNRGLIQVDGIIRENAEVFKDEKIEVRKVRSKPAESIVLSPIDNRMNIPSPEEARNIIKIIAGLYVIIGDKVKVVLFGSRGHFSLVEGTSPSGPVLISQNTDLKFKSPDIIYDKTFRISYEDIGGLDGELMRIREMIELPLKYPDIFLQLGIEAIKGVFIYGPPGTGKTLIARAIASEVNAHFIHVNGPEIIHKYYGESEAKLREVFEEARKNAPSIIFLDEIDAIAPKRAEVIGDVEKRVVAQLLALMDGLITRGEVVVIGATNIPSHVDPALRRPGRFDREIMLNIPNRVGRYEILKIHTKNMPLDDDVDLENLADITRGYVGADLEVLSKEAGIRALRRMLPEIQSGKKYKPFEEDLNIKVSYQDFLDAFKEIQPTTTREFFAERPYLKFKDVGGHKKIKKTLLTLVKLTILKTSFLEDSKVQLPQGIMFSGPSGTGKTLLAKAIAGETGLTLITVEGPLLFSKWLGESEKGLNEVFKRAKHASPCILFFDDIDAIASVRSSSGEFSDVSQRMLSQLITELDRLKKYKEIIVLAATNRIDFVDPSLRRGGRFDYILKFELPDKKERKEIFKIHASKMHLDDDVSVDKILNETEGFTGAEIETICKRASLSALERFLEKEELKKSTKLIVKMENFIEAIKGIEDFLKDKK